MSSVVLGTHLVLRGDGTISLALDEDVHILKEDAYDALIDGIDQLKTENAALRELLKAAYNCTNAGPSCLECRVVAGGCTLLSAMRELGVDVP